MQALAIRLALRWVIVVAFAALAGAITPGRPIKATDANRIYLPMATDRATSASQFPVVQAALDRINHYRSLAGVRSVQAHPALSAAAQNHAAYTILNDGDPSAWVNGPHGEVAGKPGFTGSMPGDRAIATHYPWAAGWEIMAYYDDPLRSADGLAATVFHRLIILGWTHGYVGYGHAHSITAAADVFDFGQGSATPTGPPGVAVLPGAGQRNTPLYGEGETPSPLPPGGSYPIGYPITLQPLYATSLTVAQAELRAGGGALVDLYPNPASCSSSCYALIPRAGLRPATTYTVHVRGAVDAAPFDIIWSFTTKPCLTPQDC